MRRILLCTAPLLILALLLAPPATAEEGDEGWSDEQGVPVEKPAGEPAAAGGGEPATAGGGEPAAAGGGEPAAAAGEPKAAPTAAGRPQSYYQKRPEDEPAPGGKQPIAAPQPFVMPTESTVVAVRKHHNATWFGNWLAVEFDMGFAVVGQAGKNVGATITFYEAGSDKPLRAAMQPYVDSAGNLSIYTQLVPVASNSRLFRAKLKIPYRAFPWPTSGPTYGVEARVRLMSRDPAGAFAVLARTTTAFTIHYEKGCGCGQGNQVDCNKCDGWKRDLFYTSCKMWGDEMGVTPSQVPCLPFPLGPSRQRDWFEARWRTKGSVVDEFQKRTDTDPSAPMGSR